MGNIVLSLTLDIIMAALLAVTIFYCWRLNGRIRLLQDSRGELARIIREFDESTQRATDSIAEIHEATKRISENIQHKIDKANFLADDLQYMIERGSKLANPGREAAAPAPAGRTPRQSTPPADIGLAARSPAAAASPRDLGKIHNVDITTGADAPAARGQRNRSRAEQELMDVLKAKESSGR